MGTEFVVGGIHAVATDPRFRRRGYYRQIMQEVLDYCSGKYETLVLITESPALYESFGFRIIPEQMSIVRNAGINGKEEFRLLHLENPPGRFFKEILQQISSPISEVEIYFGSDRLDCGVNFEYSPFAIENTYLMVKGPFAAEGQIRMLPRSARC
jgi:predicted acetyltransferase